MPTQISKRRLKRPPLQTPQRPKVPTLEATLSDIRKAYGMQLETFVVQFVDSHTDNDIEAFLPADLSEADEWIEGLVSAFTDNEEPTTDEMLDGASAIFMMAFLERLYEVCGVSSGDDEEDPEDESEDDK